MPGIVFLQPTLEATARAGSLAPRLGTLNGKVIGTLWNNRPKGDIILRRISERLQERWKIKEIVQRKKTFINSGAPTELLQELKNKCDGVVIAVGD